MMQHWAVNVLVRHAAKPQRPPFQVWKMADRISADRDEGAFNRAKLIQVLDGEELRANEHIEREERSAQYGKRELSAFRRYLPLLSLRK